jgi:hypothetical protein
MRQPKGCAAGRACALAACASAHTARRSQPRAAGAQIAAARDACATQACDAHRPARFTGVRPFATPCRRVALRVARAAALAHNGHVLRRVAAATAGPRLAARTCAGCRSIDRMCSQMCPTLTDRQLARSHTRGRKRVRSQQGVGTARYTHHACAHAPLTTVSLPQRRERHGCVCVSACAAQRNRRINRVRRDGSAASRARATARRRQLRRARCRSHSLYSDGGVARNRGSAPASPPSAPPHAPRPRCRSDSRLCSPVCRSGRAPRPAAAASSASKQGARRRAASAAPAPREAQLAPLPRYQPRLLSSRMA